MRSCKVCAHPRRPEIDAQLRAGRDGTRVAQDFGIPTSTLYRHRGKCLKSSENSSQPSDLGTAEEIAAALRELHCAAREILADAGAETDPKKRVEALRVARQVLSDLGKLTAGVGPSQESLHRSEAWAELRSLLLDALRPHPAARRDVVAVLRSWEEGVWHVQPSGP